jgi:ubiquinone/menaquinone biosynthesis C-methylase UbiE
MRKIEKIIANHSEWFRDRKVLDVACGDGDFSIAAARHAKTVAGIDVSLDKAGSVIEEGLPKNVRLIEMDGSEFDFPDEYYDAVFVYNALAHLTETIGLTTREMIRVLKTGGDLCIIATWKMDRAILKGIGDRAPDSGMALLEAVDDPAYTARAWRKEGPGSGGVWVRPA